MKALDRSIDALKIMSNYLDVFCGIKLERQDIIQDIVTAKGLKGRLFPEKLYHYTDLNGVTGIIKSNHLWAIDYRSLNDSSELVYGVNLLVDELEKYGDEYGGDISKLLKRLSNYYRKHGGMCRNFFETYIISLSEDPDVLSQWRAYSDGAKGCCIEFSFTDSCLFTIVGENIRWALEVLPVIYDECNQRRLMRFGIKKLLNYLNSMGWAIEKVANSSEVELDVYMGLLMYAFHPFVIAFKHPSFCEEREWRAIVLCAKNLAEAHEKERASNFGKSSYLECVFIRSNNGKQELFPITGIKHGPLAEENAKKKIKKQLSLNGYENKVVHSDSIIPLRK